MLISRTCNHVPRLRRVQTDTTRRAGLTASDASGGFWQSTAAHCWYLVDLLEELARYALRELLLK
jgi:hypothetical protein